MAPRSRALISLLALAVLLPVAAQAQDTRSYHYPSIVISADVQEDSTVEIQERLTYKFVGTYHQGYREIPHKSLGAITDIQVSDTTAGKTLEYSGDLSDINDPTTWGKYTYREEDGATVVEWNFEETDSEHTWLVQYTVHGAIGFYRNFDEFYWNLFTEYDVPVDSVVATIGVPGSVPTPQTSFYSYPEVEHSESRPNDRTFVFEAKNIPAQGQVTVAVGWQKGLVDQRAYWIDFLKLNALFFYSILIVVAAIVYSLIYERIWHSRVHGKGTIIAQYEPPENLPPAQAEYIVKRSSSDKAWAATIVDLAVRGYVTIKAEEEKWAWGSVVAVVVVLVLVVTAAVAILVGVLSSNDLLKSTIGDIVTFVFIAAIYLFVFRFARMIWKVGKEGTSDFFTQRDYVIERTSKTEEDLEDYEKAYLKALTDGGEFSTKAMRKSPSKGQEMY